MQCPKCGCDTAVTDSRPRQGTVARRRKCASCGHNFATKEIVTERFLSQTELDAPMPMIAGTSVIEESQRVATDIAPPSSVAAPAYMESPPPLPFTPVEAVPDEPVPDVVRTARTIEAWTPGPKLYPHPPGDGRE